jgi:cardiolipin synthase
MIDGFGSKDLGDDFLLALQEAGVHLLIYRPQISPWTLRRERLRRLHRKIVVVDARIAFVGGINIIDDMHTPKQVPPRFDYAVRVEGPLLEQIHESVVNVWTLVMWTQFRRRGPEQSIPVQTASCGSRRGAFVVRDNVRHRNDIESAYLEAVAHAGTEVLIANAYFFPGMSFRRALADAAERGVRVVLLLQGRVEYVLLHYASRALYRYFLDAGVEIYEYHRSFLHAKVAVVDDCWSTVGSSNIDPMSLLLAREANVIIDDADFARQLKASLNDAMTLGAVRVDTASWQRQSLPARMMTWICYELVRFLTGWSSYGRAREFIK